MACCWHWQGRVRVNCCNWFLHHYWWNVADTVKGGWGWRRDCCNSGSYTTTDGMLLTREGEGGIVVTQGPDSILNRGPGTYTTTDGVLLTLTREGERGIVVTLVPTPLLMACCWHWQGRVREGLLQLWFLHHCWRHVADTDKGGWGRDCCNSGSYTTTDGMLLTREGEAGIVVTLVPTPLLMACCWHW